jgi:hypothetical protein
MLRIRITALFLLALCNAWAQKIVMENGGVLCDGKRFFNYTIDGEKIKTLQFAASEFGEKLNPETTGVPFRDYSFRNNDETPFAYVTAKVLSSPSYTFLKYYYRVEFPAADTYINVIYHPYFLEFFARDMAKYAVLKDDKIEPSNILRLIATWRAKPDAMDDKVFVNASSCSYNSSPYNIENPKYSSSYLRVKNNNIYLTDTLYARYRLAKGLIASALPGNSKNDFYYYIETPDGRNIADFQVKKQHSAVYFWPTGYKAYLQLYTAVRDEEKLVWEVVNCILSAKNNK